MGGALGHVENFLVKVAADGEELLKDGVDVFSSQAAPKPLLFAH